MDRRRWLARVAALAVGVSGCTGNSQQSEPAADDAIITAEAGADGSTTEPTMAEPAAVQGFWAAFHDERYADLPGVIAGLENALASTPNDAYMTLLLALAHLWKVAEWDRDPTEPAPLRGQHALAAEDLFVRAWELNPDDARIARWLGALRVRQGRLLGDQAKVDDGWTTLDRGIEDDPGLTFFARAMVLSDAPPGSAELEEAVATLLDNIDVCPPPSAGAEEPCTATPKIPHRPEGFWLTAGDILAKSGDAQRAQAFYETITEFDGYTEWRFRDLVEERLANVEARVALYQDDDASNDPQTVNRSTITCTVCHAD